MFNIRAVCREEQALMYFCVYRLYWFRAWDVQKLFLIKLGDVV